MQQQQQQQQSLTNDNNNSTPHHQPQLSSLFPLHHHFDPSAAADDDFFLDHMLSTLTSPSPSWPNADHDFPLPDPSSSKLRLHQIASDQFMPHLNGMGGGSIEALYNGFSNDGSGSMQGIMGSGQAPVTFMNQGGGSGQQSSPSLGSSEARGSNDGGTAAQTRQRVRARRGQATDPHSIAERLRRERIAERMKSLQELVPNANKTDKASMLDEIIDYVKFLQLQVKVLSLSRLGGAVSVAPVVADMSSEGGPIEACQPNGSDGNAGDGSLAVTENQVAKLMEEDMGSAMQYLQGKGLCLMPISLATAISTVTCQSRAPKPLPPPQLLFGANGNGPSSPGLSTLTGQSATTVIGNAAANGSAKDSGAP